MCIRDRDWDHAKAVKRRIAALERRASKLDRLLKKLYEDYALERIPESRYDLLSAEYETELAHAEEAIAEEKQRLEKMAATQDIAERLLELARRFQDCAAFSDEQLNLFTDRVIAVSYTHLDVYKRQIYARRSVENSGKSEKVDVITNQIEICKSYIAGCPYLDLVDVYVDNGRTGTVFDRPEFNRLMTDIKSGRIKCLVVRDLSRFGRDYIETGTYLERIFPPVSYTHLDVYKRQGYDEHTLPKGVCLGQLGC